MIRYNLLLFFILPLFIISCKSNSGEKKSDFTFETGQKKTEFQLKDTLKIQIGNPKDLQIDSLKVFLEDKIIVSGTEATNIDFVLSDQKLGIQNLRSVIYHNGTRDTLSRTIKIYNNTPPVIYTYKVINTYPHDASAYTQGLEFYRDTLYESTGQFGSSTLRKTDYTTGVILEQVKLADQFFGEGISILEDKIYQLTWQGGKGFIYSTENLERTGSFQYGKSKEGWGLCNDGNRFYKSDGTDKIWILNPKTLAEESYIQPATHRSISTQLNELEWVDGKIYANTYQKDGVAIINPENGAIEGIIDFKGLREQVKQHPALDVLNGIAYNPSTKKLYVTGKNWNKLFEVEIQKK